MPGARFFPNARLNFAENLLRYRGEQTAIIFRNECGARREICFRQLHEEVARVAEGLRSAGVVAVTVSPSSCQHSRSDDRHARSDELGAVWSSCSPDFGVRGVLDRLGQIAPKVLFAADGYHYAGKTVDSLAPMAVVLANLRLSSALSSFLRECRTAA